MKNNKKIILGSILGIFIGLVISVTYAIFSYTATSANQELVTGDIYMHYKETNTLTLENALPSTSYDSSKYFEFTIDGKNTNTKYDIYYDINLIRGDVPDGKLERNRIQDKFIKFRLTEFIEGVETEIFTNKKYSDLSSGKRIHVDTISKNTMNEVTHRYRLYMWISNDVVIGNEGNPGIDYNLTEWNNLFASIKVSSTGDFTEKEVDNSTDASCFISFKEISNPILNSPLSSDALNACISYVQDWSWDTGETPEAFCNGTGTRHGKTFQETSNNYPPPVLEYFLQNNIITADFSTVITSYDSSCGSEVVIPNSLSIVTYENPTLNSPLSSDALNACISYVQNWSWDTGETPEAFCNGTGTQLGKTFQETANHYPQPVLEYFVKNNVVSADVVSSKYPVKMIYSEAFKNANLTKITIPSDAGIYDDEGNEYAPCDVFKDVEIIKGSERLICPQDASCFTTSINNNEVTITDYNTECGTKVVIPSKINNMNVTIIGQDAFYNKQITSVVIPNSVTTIGFDAFNNNQLTSVVIPNSVTTIGSYAFGRNQLTSVVIPGSVTTIDYNAFERNQLTSVQIENGVQRIERDAFINNSIPNVTIPSSVTYLDCNAFDQTVEITKENTNLECTEPKVE